MTCPDCKGERRTICHVNFGPGRGGEWREMDCSRCHGVGSVSAEQAAWIEDGERLRNWRVRGPHGYQNMATAANKYSITVVEWSGMERGLMPMPPAIQAMVKQEATTESKDGI